MMLGMKGRRYYLWWFGGDGERGYANVVEVRRVSDRVMAVLLLFDVLRQICWYAPQSGRSF